MRFYIAQAEGPAPWADIIAQAPKVPCAIVTNFGGLSDADCAALIAAKWACLPECYISQDPNCTPDRQDYEAVRRGWTRSQPVLGCFGGKTLADFDVSAYTGWSVYLAEYIL